jgi:hypothetical protein
VKSFFPNGDWFGRVKNQDDHPVRGISQGARTKSPGRGGVWLGKCPQALGETLDREGDACRAIGSLEVSGIEKVGNGKLVHFLPSVRDMAHFRKGERVRLSLNDPDGENFIEVVFLGLTEKGLSISAPAAAAIHAKEGGGAG